MTNKVVIDENIKKIIIFLLIEIFLKIKKNIKILKINLIEFDLSPVKITANNKIKILVIVINFK